MIPPAAIALVAPAPVLLAFAPPLARTFRYVVTETFVAGEHVRLTRTETLRFASGPAGTNAALALDDLAIDAPPAPRAALEHLLRPLVGIETRVALAADGRVGAPIDSDTAWAAFLVSRRALDARIVASKVPSPALAATGRAVLKAEMDPAHRDDRLREPFLVLLPPVLPPLRPGEARAFAATIPTPGGPLPASGEVRLIAATPSTLRYRLTLATSPEIGAAAAARLRASLPADASPETRARIEHAASTLAARAFAETTELVVTRPSGLVARALATRETVAADGTRGVVSTREIVLLP